MNQDALPLIVGPYSLYKQAGSILFCSGQIGLDPSSNVLPSSLESQVHQSLKNLEKILTYNHLTLKNVVKTTLFLKDIKTFDKVNEIYSAYFRENPPARSTVEVSALPKGALFEIEAIALFDK